MQDFVVSIAAYIYAGDSSQDYDTRMLRLHVHAESRRQAGDIVEGVLQGLINGPAPTPLAGLPGKVI